ncbi:MAG: VCBS repeat-containing protein [Lysobacterales bacterium]|nr:VCBS repeat-containing protein [Xanthomonadales bacterium]MCB1611048.1 VCBS repeat-containing protein [Xanthomonadales bacterium]MCP5474521.1 VCBS repeat-containing protein [Rhodanobacteraceae bacterium]
MFRKAQIRQGVLTALLLLGISEHACSQGNILVQSDSSLLPAVPTLKLLARDLTLDDRADVVAIRFDSSGSTQDRIVIQWQRPQPASTSVVLESAQTLPTSLPVDIELADLDADGDPDLLVAQESTNDTLAVWMNQGGAQQGSAGIFRRHSSQFSADLVAAVASLSLTQSAPTARDFILVRGIGRPSQIYATVQPENLPLRFELVQTLPHAGAVGATVGDLDGDGLDDLVLFGTQTRLWLHQGTGPDPMIESDPPAFAGIGTVFAAALRDLDGDNDLDLILGAATGDLVFRHDGLDQNGVPSYALSQSLGAGTPGISRAYAWIDADGDGSDDLVAARSEGSTPTSIGGTQVYARSGINFAPAPMQHLPPAHTIAALPPGIGSSTYLWLGSLDASNNELWRSASSPPLLPIASLGQPLPGQGASGYFVGNRVGAYLHVSPAIQQTATLGMQVSGSSGLVGPFGASIQPGTSHLLATVSVPANPEQIEFWTIDLLEAVPGTAAAIGSANQATVLTMPSPIGNLRPSCYVACLLIGVCSFPTETGTPDAGSPTSSLLMGTQAEVTLLQRLRDERMAMSPGGAHYIALYESLQLDLYQATFVDPSFYLELWQLKDAWMPAIASLVDGDGSMVVSTDMRDRLRSALLRFESLGSVALAEAITRERAALDLDGLAGLPISSLQQRWQASPVFASGFE